MTDELKTDAEKAMADTKATIASLEKTETSVTGWVKTHTAALIGLVCFVVGIFVGHHLH